MATVDIGVAFVPVSYDIQGNPSVPTDTTALEVNKFDLDIDELGSLKAATKHMKLVQQVIRAVVNENIYKYLKKVNVDAARPEIVEAIGSFQSIQKAFIQENDPVTLGWDLYRVNQRARKLEKINQSPITDYFEDSPLPLGEAQGYSLINISKTGIKSSILENVIAVPSVDGRWAIYNNVIIKQERRSLQFFFSQNRLFNVAEILATVGDITVSQTTDPRGVAIGITAWDLARKKFSEMAKILTDPLEIKSLEGAIPEFPGPF